MSSQPHNVADFLLQGKDPGRVALFLVRGEVTYGQLQLDVDRAARAVLALGVEKDAPVLLAGENSPFWVAAYLGILRAGRVVVPLPTTVPEADLEEVIRVTGARVAFGPARFGARPAVRRAGLRCVSEAGLPPAGGGPDSPAAGIHRDDLAAIMFTSGSTGRPRGVMVSHGNIIANTESIIESLRLGPDDRILTVLPFHYCFGTSLLHTHLRVGGSLVLEPRFLYPETVLRRMIDAECSGFAGVPSHYQILLRNSSLRRKQFPCLRYVQQAGGRLAPALIEELCAALPNTQVFVMYGQTEATARLSYLPPDHLKSKPGSIGRGLPGVQLRVLDPAGRDVQPGQTGEVVARGPNVTRGYWRSPEETAASFRDGALYTGDLATVDQDGFIFLTGRARDFLKCGGRRIGCRQIEDELLAFDELLEAAVVGIDDDLLGESVRAYVVPRQSCAGGIEERVRLFCKRRLCPEFVPREIVVLEALPKNSAGKILKNCLPAPPFPSQGKFAAAQAALNLG